LRHAEPAALLEIWQSCASTTFDAQLAIAADENSRLYFEIQSLNDYRTGP